MKKYIVKLAFLALGSIAVVSCDEDTVTYGGTNFVTLPEVASLRFNTFENVDIAEIPVSIAFPQSTDVVVTYKISNSTAIAGEDYVNLTPDQVTIPAGATSTNIRIQIIDNDELDDSKSMDIELTSVNKADITLGMVDRGSVYKKFLIVNDDCTTNFLPFITRYNVVDADDVTIGTATADVNDIGQCNVLRLRGTLDEFSSGMDPEAFIDVTLNPGAGGNKNSGTITSDAQYYCTECLNYDGKSQTVSLKVGGNFSNTKVNNPTTGSIQLSLSSQYFIASAVQSIGSSSVRLRAVN